MQRIPVWWRWYYWTSPVAWTLYGMTVSQFGDDNGMLDTGVTTKQFLEDYFGYKHDFLPAVVAAEIAFPVFFAIVFALGIKFFNFQRR